LSAKVVFLLMGGARSPPERVQMFGLMKVARVMSVGMLILAGLVASAQAEDIWVSGTGSDAFGDGSSGSPYRTISTAMDDANSGDTIKVRTGDYDFAAGESFPILLKDGVSVLGQETVLTSYPRLGGDLIDNGAITTGEQNAVLVLDVTTADKSGITVSKLHFLGEDETNEDSPVALRVIFSGGHALNGFTFADNVCDRPHQNGSGNAGSATVHVEAINGTVSDSSILRNTIEVSDCGGIEILAQAGAGETTQTDMALTDNVVRNTGGVSADFGIRWEGIDGGVNFGDYLGGPDFYANVIRSYDEGMAVGLEIVCGEHSDYGGLFMDANWIDGCSGDGLRLTVDGWDEEVMLPEVVTVITRNRLTNNGGSGLVFDLDPDQDATGMAYLAMSGGGNLLANNGEYGMEWRGYGEATIATVLTFSNDTIVANAAGGLGYTSGDEDYAPLPIFSNCIMWGNNGNGEQVYGLPSSVLDELEALVHNSDWKGIAATQGNIDTNPNFVNAAAKNYHLDDDPLSPCVDAGDDDLAGGLPPLDLDREDRTQDGDCAGGATIDMGYDELPEDCP
jgi:hypothetical protein